MDQKLIQVPEESEVIRKIYELYQYDGMTASSVAAAMSESSFKRIAADGTEKKFTYEFVARILDNEFYCGRVYYNRRTNKKDRNGKTIKLDESNVISAKGQHEPIVSEDIWEAVHKKRVEMVVLLSR